MVVGIYSVFNRPRTRALQEEGKLAPSELRLQMAFIGALSLVASLFMIAYTARPGM